MNRKTSAACLAISALCVSGCDFFYPSVCGGITGETCAEGLYCRFDDGTCGSGDQTGFCRIIPVICTLEIDLVCGCDGRTYINACEAAEAGISLESRGECPDNDITVAACGGLLGLPCADGEFCNHSDGSCGAADQTGECEVIPEICTEEFAPVCGCDDQTYSNRCMASAAGVSVAGQGECNRPGVTCGGVTDIACPDGEFCRYEEGICGAGLATGSCREIPGNCTLEFDPVCGCDGETYANECSAYAAGVSVDSQEQCGQSGTACGGLLGLQCADGEFCNYTDGSCGAADQTGECQGIPENCTLEFAPVCGCDGETYSNACSASAAGVSVASQGECGDGSGAFCGGIAGVSCPDGEFCKFELGTCGAADQSGLCETIPEVCTEEFAPVCGCDDETYANECMASAAGVSVNTEGECP